MNGTVETNVDGTGNSTVRALAVQQNGRIVAAGVCFHNSDFRHEDFAIVRYLDR